MFKHLKRIEKCLERLVDIEYERNELIKEDMENETRFKDTYLENMNKATERLTATLEDE